MTNIGFGGGCHWCTEAIFSSLKGVTDVRQGWLAAIGQDPEFSEGVIVTFDEDIISLETLIAVHLYTHSCTSNHRMRSKYRSAIYAFDEKQAAAAKTAINNHRIEFDRPIITEVLPYQDFKLNQRKFLNYYYSDPQKPFCENRINPRLNILMQRFSKEVNMGKMKHLKEHHDEQ